MDMHAQLIEKVGEGILQVAEAEVSWYFTFACFVFKNAIVC